eukprot:3845844-Amphidinium_carterae.1
MRWLHGSHNSEQELQAPPSLRVLITDFMVEYTENLHIGGGRPHASFFAPRSQCCGQVRRIVV